MLRQEQAGPTGVNAVHEQGAFYTHPPHAVTEDPNPYAIKVLESSPLGRLLEQGAPGSTWQPKADKSGKTVKFQYTTNTANEVRLFSMANLTDQDLPVQDGYYASGQLFVTVTEDEHGSQTKTYRDKLDRVVLKRSMLSAHEPLDTYYIYDIYSNLRTVIQPEGMRHFEERYENNKEQFLDHWAFQYRYDGRKRMIGKKVPGAGWVQMVYDQRDRLILSQDANQRAEGKWLFTKYDALNRPVITGWYESGQPREQLQEQLNGEIGQAGGYEWYESKGEQMQGYDNASFPGIGDESDLLSVTYYDRYDIMDHWGEAYGYQRGPHGLPVRKAGHRKGSGHRYDDQGVGKQCVDKDHQLV